MLTNLPNYCIVFILVLGINIGSWAQTEKKVRPKESDVLLEKLFIEASREKILGNIDEAIHRYLEVLQKDNNNAAANYELARLYKRQEQVDKAILRAEKAVENDEFNLLYNELYASLLEKEANYKKAAELYAGLTNKYPSKEALHFEWAYFLSKNGKPDQAIKVFNNLEKRVGIKETISMRKYKLYMAMGKDKKASQEIENLIEAFPTEAEYVLRLANFYASSNEFDKAKALYQKALDIDPDNSTANMAMVGFYLQNGDTVRYLNALINTIENPNQDLSSKTKTVKGLSEQVIDNKMQQHRTAILELSSKLVNTHPSSPDANLIYGNLLFHNNDYKKALKHYKVAILRMNNNLNLWQNLLECLHVMDDQVNFQKRSTEFFDLYPSQASGFCYYGIALFQQEKYDRAIKILQEAINIAVSDSQIQGTSMRYLARIYDAQNNKEKADKTFQEAMQLLPNDLEIINDYAYTLALRGSELSKATTLVNGILKKAPKNFKYKTTRGFILFKEAKYTLAEQEISKAIDWGGTESAVTLERYGDVQFKLGNETEALNYWQKALDKGANSELLKRKISTKQWYE